MGPTSPRKPGRTVPRARPSCKCHSSSRGVFVVVLIGNLSMCGGEGNESVVQMLTVGASRPVVPRAMMILAESSFEAIPFLPKVVFDPIREESPGRIARDVPAHYAVVVKGVMPADHQRLRARLEFPAKSVKPILKIRKPRFGASIKELEVHRVEPSWVVVLRVAKAHNDTW